MRRRGEGEGGCVRAQLCRHPLACSMHFYHLVGSTASYHGICHAQGLLNPLSLSPPHSVKYLWKHAHGLCQISSIPANQNLSLTDLGFWICSFPCSKSPFFIYFLLHCGRWKKWRQEVKKESLTTACTLPASITIHLHSPLPTVTSTWKQGGVIELIKGFLWMNGFFYWRSSTNVGHLKESEKADYASNSKPNDGKHAADFITPHMHATP